MATEATSVNSNIKMSPTSPDIEAPHSALTSTPNAKTTKQSPMIVVSNRLPFVLKRDEDGILHRKARYTLQF